MWNTLFNSSSLSWESFNRKMCSFGRSIKARTLCNLSFSKLNICIRFCHLNIYLCYWRESYYHPWTLDVTHSMNYLFFIFYLLVYHIKWEETDCKWYFLVFWTRQYEIMLQFFYSFLYTELILSGYIALLLLFEVSNTKHQFLLDFHSLIYVGKLHSINFPLGWKMHHVHYCFKYIPSSFSFCKKKFSLLEKKTNFLFFLLISSCQILSGFHLRELEEWWIL